jgi:hypothetical protein
LLTLLVRKPPPTEEMRRRLDHISRICTGKLAPLLTGVLAALDALRGSGGYREM